MIVAYHFIPGEFSSSLDRYIPKMKFEYSKWGQYQAGLWACRVVKQTGNCIAVKIDGHLWVLVQVNDRGRRIAMLKKRGKEIPVPIGKFASYCEQRLSTIEQHRDIYLEQLEADTEEAKQEQEKSKESWHNRWEQKKGGWF